jgi:hypothetical protein
LKSKCVRARLKTKAVKRRKGVNVITKGFSAKEFHIAADEAVNSASRKMVWGIFDNYLVQEQGDGKEPYFYAPVDLPEGLPGGKEPFQLLVNPWRRDPWSDGQALRMYSPLDVSGLFLEFASLVDDPGLDDEPHTDNNRVVALDWIGAYGVLGLTPTGFDSLTGRIHQGGEADSLSRFVEEAAFANATLRLFEAATAPDGPDIDFIQRGIPEGRKDHYVQNPTEARKWALARVAHVVQGYLESYCYPSFRVQENETVILHWQFQNLLGAMWIQMTWLLTSTGKTRRCARPGCTKIITFESGQPLAEPGLKKNSRGKYRTRIDKQFCTPLCRVKNHQQKQKGRNN